MKYILIFVSLFLLSACSENIHSNKSLRSVSSYEDVRKLVHEGMTKEQVRNSLGEPMIKNVINRQSIWLYGYRKRNLNTTAKVLSSVFTGDFAGDVKRLTIIFNDQGLVTNINYEEENGVAL